MSRISATFPFAARRVRSLGLVALAVGLVACAGDDGATSDSSSESATTSGTSGDSDSTTGDSDSTTGTTTDGGLTSTSAPTSTSETTAATSETTAATTTTTGGATELPESCVAACDVVYGCFPESFDSFDDCVDTCLEASTPEEPDPACEGAALALNNCIAAAKCSDLEGEAFCVPEQDAFGELCDNGGEECFGGGGSNPEGTECSLSEECVGEYKHELRCTTDTCECLDDDVVVATCPQENNLCAEFDFTVLGMVAEECCGW